MLIWEPSAVRFHWVWAPLIVRPVLGGVLSLNFLSKAAGNAPNRNPATNGLRLS